MGTEILLTVILGTVIVFIGLICIVILSKIMSAVCNIGKSVKTENKAPAAPVAVQPAAQPIENRQEIIAAVSAAVAEDMGTDISAIRILSFKKV